MHTLQKQECELELARLYGFTPMEDERRGPGWHNFYKNHLHVWHTSPAWGEEQWQTAVQLIDGEFVKHESFPTLAEAFQRRNILENLDKFLSLGASRFKKRIGSVRPICYEHYLKYYDLEDGESIATLEEYTAAMNKLILESNQSFEDLLRDEFLNMDDSFGAAVEKVTTSQGDRFFVFGVGSKYRTGLFEDRIFEEEGPAERYAEEENLAALEQYITLHWEE